MGFRYYNHDAYNTRGSFNGSASNGGNSQKGQGSYNSAPPNGHGGYCCPPQGHGGYEFPAHGQFPPGPPIGSYAPPPLRPHLSVEPGRWAFQPGPPPGLQPHRYNAGMMPVPQPLLNHIHERGPAFEPVAPCRPSAAQPPTFNTEAVPIEPQADPPKKKNSKSGYRTQRPSRAQRERRCRNMGCPCFWNHRTDQCVERTGGPEVWGRRQIERRGGSGIGEHSER